MLELHRCYPKQKIHLHSFCSDLIKLTQPQLGFVRWAQNSMKRQAQSILENSVRTFSLSHFAPVSFHSFFWWDEATDHRDFWEQECKQDLSKENKLETTHQLYHLSDTVLTLWEKPVLKAQERSGCLVRIRHCVCSGTWKSICSTVILLTSAEEHPSLHRRRCLLAAGRKAGAGNRTDTVFQTGTFCQRGIYFSWLSFHPRTEKNRKLKL